MRSRTFELAARVLASSFSFVLAATPVAQAQLEDSGDAERVASATRLALLVVQQGLTALQPPTAQSATYVYDSDQEVFRRNDQPGPISFLTAETVGAGVGVFRMSAATFTVDDQVDVRSRFDALDADGNLLDSGEGVESVGIDAAVYIFSLGFTYGVTSFLDVSVSLPLVIADVQGFAPDTERSLRFVLRDQNGFEDDAAIGVGQIGLGAKLELLDTDWLDAAFAVDLLFPSPHERHYAGPESFAFFPQLSLVAPLAPWVTLGGSVGYNRQLDDEELRRIAWKAGAWTSIVGATVDVGVTGTEFDEDVTILPESEIFEQDPPFEDGTSFFRRTSVGNARLDNSYVAAVGGVKWPVSRSVSVTAGVTIPVVSDGITPAVIGSLGLEYQGGLPMSD